MVLKDFIYHIKFTLYSQSSIDRKLIKRLVRLNGKKEFREKVFKAKDVHRIIHEPQLFKYFQKFSSSKNLEETVERMGAVPILKSLIENYPILHKITFIISDVEHTRRVFTDVEDKPFKICFTIHKLKIPLKSAYSAKEFALFPNKINELIENFKKLVDMEFFDEEMFSDFIEDRTSVVKRSIPLYQFLVTNKDISKNRDFRTIAKFVINVINNEFVINSNCYVILE